MKIVFTDEAILNLRNIHSYLRERDPAAAATIGLAIRKSAEMLSEFRTLDVSRERLR